MSWVPILVGVLGAVVGPLGAYLIARHQRSGSVDSSEATTLWQESQAMRRELRDEVLSLRGHIAELRARVTELERENRALRERMGQ